MFVDSWPVHKEMSARLIARWFSSIHGIVVFTSKSTINLTMQSQYIETSHIVQLSCCSDMSGTESERFANAWASNEDIRFCTSDFKAALRFGRKIPMEQSKPWQYIFAFCWAFLLCQRSLSWTMKNIHHSVVEFLFGQSTNR